jgi:hypothetical protein
MSIFEQVEIVAGKTMVKTDQPSGPVQFVSSTGGWIGRPRSSPNI